MLKAYKYRIEPTTAQKEQLQRFFGVVRLIYNLGLETKMSAYASGVTLTRYDLQKQLPDLKKEFEWIAECPSQSLQKALFDLDTAYINFFKGRAAFPRFKNRFRKQSIHFPQNVKVDFEKGVINLPKLKDIRVVYSRHFGGKVKSATLSKTTTNKYYISILVDTLTEKPKQKLVKRETSVGLDFGIKDLVITSDGEIFKNLKFYKSQQRRLRIEQRSLARKQKGGKNREKQRLRVALLHEKIRNRRIDYLHKISTHLIRKYDTIIIEDLAVENMVQNHNLAKAISDMGWRELRRMLEYKAEWYGKNIVVIGRFDPSSKLCSNCGNLKKTLKLSERTYKCEKCGISIDRDKNAAINIKNFGLIRTQPSHAKVSH